MLAIKIFNDQNGEFQERILIPALINQGEWLIGRDANCDLILPMSDISRIHGRIKFYEGEYYFTDFGSANGSSINRQVSQIRQNYPL